MRSFPLLPLWILLTVTASACSPGPGSDRDPDGSGNGTSAEAAEAETPPTPPLITTLDAEAEAWVERTLSGMSLRQRVAQLVMPWISGASASANPAELRRMLDWVRRDEVGGLIVSTGSATALAAKLNAAQGAAPVPLLVTSDLETGPGMRLSPGGTRMPPAMAFGAAGDEELVREAGRVTAREARAVGIHLTLAPVLDVNSNPENPIINVRSFGEDPEMVARLGTAWMLGAREEGLLSAGKHFPGHGDTRVDSHVGLARIPADSARLWRNELVPFRTAVHAGMDAMLVGHLAVTALEGEDAPPASLSRRITTGLLREELGFEGLVITDALNMGGVTRRHSVPEASIRALEAGADVLLQPPGTSEVISKIVQAVESGRIPAERIDEAARRVLRTKAAAGLHRRARVDLDSLPAVVGAPAHHAVAARAAQASITLARDAAGLVPLPRGRVLHVVYTRTGSGSAGNLLHDELARGGVQVERVRVGANTGARAYDALRERARSADLVLLTVAVAPHQYRGMDLPAGLGTFVERLGADRSRVALVSLGSPYLLEAFPSVSAYLLAWSSDAVSQRAAARALLGEAPIRGTLPVSLPPDLPAGHGIPR